MSHYLHIKKFICKILTGFLPEKQRILCREALYWFSFTDFIRFKCANYKIVSLGSNCLPRGLTTALHIKPRRFYGEKSYPFDLSVNEDLEKIIHFIETDFVDYFDDITINDKVFPHDYKLPENEFIKRYKNRIKNFQNVLKSDKILYFIYSNYTKVVERDIILKLYKVLESKRNGMPFELVVLTKKYIPNIPEILQFPDNFIIDDSAWLVYIIDEYKEYDNRFTHYRDRMKKHFINLCKL